MSAIALERPRLSTARQAVLSLFWFGVEAQWTAILITTLPSQAFLIGGDEAKGRTLGAVLAAGALVSMVVAPVFGALSDRIVTRWGRRKPWVLVGTLMNVVGLYGLAHAPRANDLSSLPLYVLAFMWVEFWNNVATAPYAALIPDTVPHEQRGSASGWLGVMTLLGNVVGGATGLLFTQADGNVNIVGIYGFVATILVACMTITLLFVREPKPQPPPRLARVEREFRLGAFARSLLDPLKDHDFRWVFWTRFLMTMGVFTVQEFLQFFFRDVVGDFSFFGLDIAQNAESAVAYFTLALLLGALVSTLAAGVLSDRVGRKRVVYVSSALQAAVPVVFLFFVSMELAVFMGVVFGLGYGAYTSVDWALASDVLPSENDHAKDMGVWHVAHTLPQVIAVPIAGILLDRAQIFGRASGMPRLGYDAIFVLAIAYFALGTLLVRKIKKAD